MHHTKYIHPDKVQDCLNYIEDFCSFGENCWFNHNELLKISESSFKCNFCENKFKTKLQLMKHKKSNHVTLITQCKYENKNCRFGSEKCWFIHSENIEKAYENAKNENTENK